MDLFIGFFMRTASYFILAYFIYNIFGRNRKLSFYLHGIFLLIEGIAFIRLLGMGLETEVILYAFMSQILPIIVSLIVFIRLTGGLHARPLSFKRKLKDFNTDIQTKHAKQELSYLIMIGSLALGTLLFFLIENETRYVLSSLSVLFFFAGIYYFLTTRKIVSERVILFIGKEKENMYAYGIPKDKRFVTIKDFFDHEGFIVDGIGEITMIDDQKKMDKDYLFWIATSGQVDTDGQPIARIESVPYQSDLTRFEKYHYKTITYQVSRRGALTKIKENQIK